MAIISQQSIDLKEEKWGSQYVWEESEDHKGSFSCLMSVLFLVWLHNKNLLICKTNTGFLFIWSLSVGQRDQMIFRKRKK